MAQTVKRLPTMQKTQVQFLGGEDLLEKEIATYSSILPLQYFCLENLRDRGAWWSAVHGVAKSRTRLSDVPFTFHFHALEKEMATYSSVLAWRILGTCEPFAVQKALSLMRSHLFTFVSISVTLGGGS